MPTFSASPVGWAQTRTPLLLHLLVSIVPFPHLLFLLELGGAPYHLLGAFRSLVLTFSLGKREKIPSSSAQLFQKRHPQQKCQGP